MLFCKEKSCTFVPNAEIHFVPSGHFALESHHTEISKLIIDFLHRVL